MKTRGTLAYKAGTALVLATPLPPLTTTRRNLEVAETPIVRPFRGFKDGVCSATQTAIFQIRAPSARKRAALLDAMKRTHLATDAVLQAMLAEIESIQALPKKIDRTNAMQRIAGATLVRWSVSKAGSAAARVDATGMVESYIQTLSDGRETASLPRILPIDGRDVRYQDALDDLAAMHATLDHEGALRDELNRMARPGSPRPFSLHGYGHFYRLLRHHKTGRLHAWINLIPSTSRFAPTQTEANRRAREEASGEMIDIATGEAVLCKKPTWVLFPLEFSMDYHERRFLFAGTPGGGRLVYRPDADRFELHASFTYESPGIETGNRFVGIDRGIYNLAAWAVTDADGRLIDTGAVSGLDLRHVQRQIERRTMEAQKRRGHVSITARRAQADEAVHRTANEIVRVAKAHSARVVIEQLTMQRRLRAVPVGNRGGHFGRAARRILGRQQYAKLVQVLTYKLARAGLPPPVEVGAAFTSQTCPKCGHVSKENRLKIRREGEDVIAMSEFRCVQCGYEADADCNAAHVIGLKGAWLLQVSTRKERNGRPLREDEKFAHYVIDAARRRGSSAEQSVVPS